jgi:uncharacterized protein (TIGR03089 family)
VTGAANRGVAAALAARLATDPARPMLTFYDDATGERTELSATTLDNWVAKTANLLTDTLGVAAGDRVGVDLPAHWQAGAVLLACWTCGLEVVLPGDPPTPGGGLAGGLAAVFVAEPDGLPPGTPAGSAGSAGSGDDRAWPDTDEVVALSLRPFGGGLAVATPGVVDYAAEVAAHGDRFGSPVTTPAQAALLTEAATLAAGWELTTRDRLLAVADRADRPGVLGWLLAPLVSGASVVLCRNADPTALGRRAASEQVTALLGDGGAVGGSARPLSLSGPAGRVSTGRD